MSTFDNVVGGKLKLKGKALNVKAGGLKKKKKNKHRHHDDRSEIERNELQEGGSSELQSDPSKDIIEADNDKEEGDEEGQTPAYHEHLTPAERRYIEQRERIDSKRLAKTANKSHRDRIQDFNQYLANMSEHYDIPKVGPG
ncbi:uncharacterized protein A4U43_C05F22480 [Asparagus officinalis]|uniref:Protein FAM32A-like n=1 Tax=Asparagus officinalis TaxID=4686 RepID=A0A5P1ETU7_ASPOF|nr:protein FAM32A-like [Asparagus officinalis]ONK69402.1 uncharacterized protein A4U43_C05F22480 [Asparagus officinalis]